MKALIGLTGALAVALGLAVHAGGQAAPQAQARIEFSATKFGGGPGHGGGSVGAPVRVLRGFLVIDYREGRITGARLESLRVSATTPPGAASWREPITTGVMRIRREGGPPWLPRGQILRVSGPACQLRVCGSTDDFSLAFQLPATLAVGQGLRFRGAGYAVRGKREVYQARAGVIRVTQVRTEQ